jgi:hypothetical protein
MQPEIQATGGVAKIYNTQIRDYDLNDDKNPIFITYKESKYQLAIITEYTRIHFHNLCDKNKIYSQKN